MSAKVIEAELGITRSSNGKYYIRIGCETSRTNFCELELNGKQFAEAITGLHSSGIKATINGLDRVGKERIRESRVALCPHSISNRDDQEKFLIENCQEEGWFIDSYLRSQSSVKRLDKEYQLKYSVFKYIEVETNGC